MAGQSFMCRVSNLISNYYSSFLSRRSLNVNQCLGIRQKVVEKVKELKIPEKPKRPLTPYFKFLQDHRSKVSREHPDWKITQIAAQCASDWKSVDPTIKTEYENEFKKEMEQYSARYLQYATNLTEDQKEAIDEYNKELKRSKKKRERRKKERENDKPKKPLGAYMMFVMDQAKQYPNRPYIELVKSLKNTWTVMPAGEKSLYVSAANKAKEKYKQELEDWEARMINEGKVDIVRQKTLINKASKSQKGYKSPLTDMNE